MTDLKLAIRTLARAPGFTAAAVLTLALGIGANTAIFSVVHAVLLRPLPYPHPEELVALHETLPPEGEEPARLDMPITPPTTRDWTAASSFASIGYYAESSVVLTGAGEPTRIESVDVSADFFRALGVPMAAGRPISAADTGPNQPPVCVISHELWSSRFGSDASIVGRRIDLSDRPHTVIGITPPGFAFPLSARIWTPLALPEIEFSDDQRLSFYLRAVARLASNVTPDAATTELKVIASRLATQFPKRYQGRGALAVPLRQDISGPVRPALLLLLGTAGCVLLIACVNVAGLMLSRGASRSVEMATRAALGASRRRLIRHLLAESVILSVIGAFVGVLLAMWARDAIVFLSPSVPRVDTVAINLPVLAFALGLAAITALAFGLVPALLTSRRALRDSLAGATKGTTAPAPQRVRGALVVAQIAVSLALLTGAGLLVKTLWNLVSVDPGFDSVNVMTMEVLLPRPKYAEPARRAEFFEAVLDTLKRNPVVTAAGGATNLPLSNTNRSFGFYRQGMTPGADAPFIANVRGITSGYFQALGIPVIRGHGLTSADRAGSQPIVVINEAMRRRFWPDGVDPIGQQISLTRGRTIIWREIVGIVGDIRHAGLGVEPEPEIYMPYAHDPVFFLRIAVRSPAPPEMLAGTMRAAVWAADPAQPVSRLRTMDEVIASSLATERFNTILIGTFAVLALMLAGVGLYGLIAYSVTLRHREFGVRLALGATPRHVLGLVLRQTMTLATTGVVIGFAIAALTTRVIETQLYRTETHDPMTLAAVAALLLMVAVVAGCVPARRAVRVDPVTALRAE